MSDAIGGIKSNNIENQQYFYLSPYNTYMDQSHWWYEEAELEAVLLVALRTAGAHLNVLQDAITAQHNAGQDAALQALQNAIAHVLQPMQGPVVP